ncbi:hypothetical protein F3J31_03975 [Enterobacter sp. Acro-832]|nr:hypothetical protein [Enterobacter sp. Acro-832]RAY96690.1 hypothetical protein DP187_22395 [Enterobacter cloacae]RTM80581.1 hypothetical protein EKO03_00035 [Enterobacter quasiroggenkampii]
MSPTPIEREMRFSLFIRPLLAKALPVRGAKFEKAAFALQHKLIVRAIRQLNVKLKLSTRCLNVALK